MARRAGKEQIKESLLRELDTLRDPRGFINAGLPRFNRLFGRDSLITAWQLLEIDPSVCRKTLQILAKLQGDESDPIREEEPGKILHETDDKPHPERPKTLPFPYYGSVDATPLFIIIAAFYFEKTGDKALIRGLWPHLRAAAKWIINWGDIDNDGFVEYARKGKGLLHQGWKDGTRDHLKIEPPVAIVEEQGYAYLALKKMITLARIAGAGSNLYDRKANQLKKDFNRRFWIEREQFFALALDGNKKQRRAITSNPGHLLFTGIAEKRHLDPLIRRLFAPDLWTPFGIRTLSTNDPDFDPRGYHLGAIWPHDNWIIAQGLAKVGAQAKYQQVQDAITNAYKELGYIPEFYGYANGKLIQVPSACHPQAWATAAVLNFLQQGPI